MGKEKIEDRRAALEGESFFVPSGSLSRALIGSDAGGLCEVHAKSKGEDGQWICISCCVPLANNFEKDTHCAKPAPRKSAMDHGKGGANTTDPNAPKAKHVLAWRSYNSGRVEVP